MRSNFLFAAAALLAATPAFGAVTVIGNTGARSCFEAAEARAKPSHGAILTCDAAAIASSGIVSGAEAAMRWFSLAAAGRQGESNGSNWMSWIGPSCPSQR